MSNIRCNLAFLAALMLIFSAASNLFCARAFAAVEDDARSAIAEAEDIIADCYRTVADADKAGANTTALLAILNRAGELLSRASLAYKMGDFDSALDFANQSQQSLNGFVAEADFLMETAIKQHFRDFMFNIVGSIVGTVVVICGSFVVWFLLKRRCEKAGSVIR